MSFAAVAILLITFSTCYMLWLADGCMAFLPFISDLGLHMGMKTTFTVGMILTAVTWALSLSHVYIARRKLIFAARLPNDLQVINQFVLAAGAGVLCGIAALGFFPWDRVFPIHLVVAAFIFTSGAGWAIGSYLISRKLSTVFVQEHWNHCPRCRQAQPLMVAALACIVALSTVFFIACLVLDARNLNFHVFEHLLRMAHDDFQGFCTQIKGVHTIPMINWMALCEWLYVAAMVGSVVASVADVGTFCSLHSTSSSTSVVPFSPQA